MPRRCSPLPLVALLLIPGIAACGGDSDGPTGPTEPVKVMTRNLYLGGEFGDLLAAREVSSLPPLVATFWQAVVASDIPGRAKVLAAEIAAEAPDLVGLQEVELFRTDTPSNFDAQAPQPNAATVRYDFLALLQAELTVLGARYTVVADHPRTDAELPGTDENGTLFDLRMTDRDVILVREDVEATPVEALLFQAQIPLQLGGQLPVPLVRGYQLVEARVRGARLLFGNTHLEVGGAARALQEEQANELARALDGRSGPLVLVGDVNSPAGGGPSSTTSYATLTRTFRDVWPSSAPGVSGFTCCSDLRSPTFDASTRIDLVLIRGGVRAQSAAVIGVDPARRTAAGLWPSDHAGVVATVAVPL